MIAPRDVQGDLGIKHQIPNVKKEGEARQKSLKSGYETPDPNYSESKAKMKSESKLGKKEFKKFTCVWVSREFDIVVRVLEPPSAAVHFASQSRGLQGRNPSSQKEVILKVSKIYKNYSGNGT
jgi:hypothetical protein